MRERNRPIVLIDIHTHCARYPEVLRTGGTRYPTPAEAVAKFDEEGIDKAVLLSTVSPEWRFLFVAPEQVLEIAAEYPDRFIPFFNLDPRMVRNRPDSDFRHLIEHYVEAGCKGVGEYCANIPFDDPLNINLFKQLEEAGLPLLFHMAPEIGGYYGVYDEMGLPRLETVLKTCPNLTLLGHSKTFWIEIADDVTPDIRFDQGKGKVTPGRVVELMREYPNLHGDLSAGSGYAAITRDPEFGCAFLEEFQDRLYFGTDLAREEQDLRQPRYYRKLKDDGLISKEAYENIAWKNADRLFGLGLDKQAN